MTDQTLFTWSLYATDTLKVIYCPFPYLPGLNIGIRAVYGRLLLSTMHSLSKINLRSDFYHNNPKACVECALRAQCTRSKDGRTLKRHRRQDALDSMRAVAGSREAKRDIRTRQHLSERSFARSTRYGYKRARWRRIWRMEIQDYLIAAVQNITILANHSERKPAGSNGQRVQGLMPCFLHWIYCIIAVLGKTVSSEPVFAYG